MTEPLTLASSSPRRRQLLEMLGLTVRVVAPNIPEVRRPVETPVDYCGVPHTPAARKVLDLSIEEANHFTPTYPIGTEHLLLALLRVPDSIGYRVLRFVGMEEAAVRATRDDLWQVLATPE